MFDYVGVLDWCFMYFFHMDHSNAAIHNALVRYSPITFRLAQALNEATGTGSPDEVAEVLAHLGAYPEDKGR